MTSPRVLINGDPSFRLVASVEVYRKITLMSLSLKIRIKQGSDEPT